MNFFFLMMSFDLRLSLYFIVVFRLVCIGNTTLTKLRRGSNHIHVY